MEKYFDFEGTVEDRKMRYACTKLKGHISFWWEHLQVDRHRRGKVKIKSWERMVSKLKSKFMPDDYQVNLFWKLQNLKHKESSVKEYTEAFYRLNIRSRNVDDEIKQVARYLNGLQMSIQDELSVIKLQSVEEAYQYALKAEEKLNKRHEQKQRGRGGRFSKERFQGGRSYSGGRGPCIDQSKDKEVSRDGSSYQKDDRIFYRRREPDGHHNESYGKDDRR